MGAGEHHRLAASAPAAGCAAAEGNQERGSTRSRCVSAWPSTATNPACSSCHRLMDPIGLSMENFDAIGRWRTKGEDGAPVDASGGLPSGATFEGVTGLKQALLARSGRVRPHGHREAADLRARTRYRAVRRARRSHGCPGFAERRLSVRDGRAQHREEHALSVEEIAMIITKMALPRRTFLRGLGTTLALPLLDAMFPAMSMLAASPRKQRQAPRLRLHPDGDERGALDTGGRRAITELSPSLAARASSGSRERPDQHGAEAGVRSRESRDRQRRVSQHRPGEEDRRQRLRTGHDLRSDRRADDWQGLGHSVARTRHGPDCAGWELRQRSGVRVHEQPLLVVADDAAADRGRSARAVRASVSAMARVPSSVVQIIEGTAACWTR